MYFSYSTPYFGHSAIVGIEDCLVSTLTCRDNETLIKDIYQVMYGSKGHNICLELHQCPNSLSNKG